LVFREQQREELYSTLKTLAPKEEKVIKLRFGVGREREYTVEEIGEEFGVSPEEITDIAESALATLHHNARNLPRLRALSMA
jgi:RNA polymerase primary sigma factor